MRSLGKETRLAPTLRRNTPPSPRISRSGFTGVTDLPNKGEMMANGVAAVWVPVTDMTRAVGFYRDTLGFTLSHEGEDWSEFDAN